MADVKKHGNTDWFDLCAWVERNIFEYEPEQKLGKEASITLRGLQHGQSVGNSNHQTFGEFPFEVIKMTFILYKTDILYGIRYKEFRNEASKMLYVCAIVRKHLNDVYTRYLNAKRSQKQIEHMDTSVTEYQGAAYKKEAPKTKNEEEIKDLW